MQDLSISIALVTRVTLAIAGISCRRVSVCPSVKSVFILQWLNVGSRKQRHTTAQGLPFSDAENLGKTQTESPQKRRQMQVG